MHLAARGERSVCVCACACACVYVCVCACVFCIVYVCVHMRVLHFVCACVCICVYTHNRGFYVMFICSSIHEQVAHSVRLPFVNTRECYTRQCGDHPDTSAPQSVTLPPARQRMPHHYWTVTIQKCMYNLSIAITE